MRGGGEKPVIADGYRSTAPKSANYAVIFD